MPFQYELDSALVGLRLHEAMDQTFYSIINSDKIVIDFGSIIKEEATARGIKIYRKDSSINEGVWSNIVSGLKQMFGRQPTPAEIRSYVNRLPPAKAQYAKSAIQNQQDLGKKQQLLQKLVGKVRDSYTSALEQISNQLYRQSGSNNEKTVIAKMHQDLKQGISKWSPKLYDPYGKKSKFDPSKLGLGQESQKTSAAGSDLGLSSYSGGSSPSGGSTYNGIDYATGRSNL
jgi:hypothetical protein